MKALVFKVKTSLQPVLTRSTASSCSLTKPGDNDILAKVLCTVFQCKGNEYLCLATEFLLGKFQTKDKVNKLLNST